jgi:hypothetical protein
MGESAISAAFELQRAVIIRGKDDNFAFLKDNDPFLPIAFYTSPGPEFRYTSDLVRGEFQRALAIIRRIGFLRTRDTYGTPNIALSWLSSFIHEWETNSPVPVEENFAPFHWYQAVFTPVVP